MMLYIQMSFKPINNEILNEIIRGLSVKSDVFLANACAL